jgi:DNA-binding YbaB/EbfC family protein
MSNPLDMLGGMGGMGGLGGMVQQMQQQMKDIQEQNAKAEFEATAGGGLVKVRVNGSMQVLSIEIDEGALNDDKEMIEDLLQVALNQALAEAQENSNSTMGALTAGLPIPPGMFG